MDKNEVIIAHEGAPCDPPNVEGVVFVPSEGGLFLGKATEEQAEHLLRIPAFRRFGGDTSKLTLPGGAGAGEGEGGNSPEGLPTDEVIDAQTAKKDVAALAAGAGVTLATEKLADMKVELKAALVTKRTPPAE